MAPINMHHVANALRRAAAIVDDYGHLIDTRTFDWVSIDPPPFRAETGDDETDETERIIREGSPSDEDRREAAQANGYHREWSGLMKTAFDTANRIEELRRIVVPQHPARLGTNDMQIGQLVADGWCGSCARDHDKDGAPHLAPVSRYSDRCRWCGDWRSANKQDPPIRLLQAKHRADREGRRLTSKVVDAALGRTA